MFVCTEYVMFVYTDYVMFVYTDYVMIVYTDYVMFVYTDYVMFVYTDYVMFVYTDYVMFVYTDYVMFVYTDYVIFVYTDYVMFVYTDYVNTSCIYPWTGFLGYDSLYFIQNYKYIYCIKLYETQNQCLFTFVCILQRFNAKQLSTSVYNSMLLCLCGSITSVSI